MFNHYNNSQYGNNVQGEKMNQIPLLPTILNVKCTEELEKSVANDLVQPSGKSITELLDDAEKKDQNNSEQKIS
jgi:hypothetical protein